MKAPESVRDYTLKEQVTEGLYTGTVKYRERNSSRSRKLVNNKQNNLCGSLAENISSENVGWETRTRPQRRSQRQQSIFRSVAGDNDENTTQ